MIMNNLDSLCFEWWFSLKPLSYHTHVHSQAYAPIHTSTTIFGWNATSLKGKTKGADLELQPVSAADETAASCGKAKRK